MDDSREIWSEALDRAVEEVLAAVGVQAPPVDALAVAREFLITIAWDARQEGRARRVKLADQDQAWHGSILLRPEPRPERRQWAIAHEIGEELAERVFVLAGADPGEVPTDWREQTANQFAGRLLVPTAWFQEAVRTCDWDLYALKEQFSTASHELLARRMLDFSDAAIVSVFDQGSLTWRRSNVHGRHPALTNLEQKAWQQAHAKGEFVSETEYPLSVRVWPIHESEWKREIMRSELSDAW